MNTNGSERYFDNFDNYSQQLKCVFNEFATLVVLIFVPLYYSVVWYERYGHDKKRTLLNQLRDHS